MKRDRGEYRPIYEVLLDGPEWRRLPADARLVFLTLKIKSGAFGIKVVSGLVESLTEWTALSSRRANLALVSLENASWIERDANLVWVVRGLEFEPTLDVTNANHRKYFRRTVDALPSLPIVARFRERYRAWDTDGIGDGIPHPLPHPPAMAIGITTTTTTPSTKKQRAKPPRAVPEWVDLARAQWAAKVGPLPPARIRKALAVLVTAHDWDAVHKALADYLTATPLSKARLEWFAERGTYWVQLAQQPLQDPATCQPTERYRVVVEGKAA